MKKIIIISCYFGKFPWYFKLFLKSCSTNNSIDFVILSDQPRPLNLPPNLKFFSFTINDFNLLSSIKLNINIKLKTAYKITDFKPAFGVIFDEYIKGHDHWGFSDIDVIYGRIREFMTNEILFKYDVISVRSDYPTGCFMLFKNNKKINNLFRKSKDYVKVFLSEKHFCFDECNFKHNHLSSNIDISEIDSDIDSFLHVIRREELKNNITPHFDQLIIEGNPGNLKWNKGLLSFKNKFEVLLYHLVVFKNNKLTKKTYYNNTSDLFHIEKFCIRNETSLMNFSMIKKIYFEKVKPYCFKKVFLIDRYFSLILNNPIKGLNNKNYRCNDVELLVQELENNEVKILFDQKYFDSCKSFIFKKSFYTKLNNGNRYRVLTDSLEEIHFDGSCQVFIKY